MKKHANAILLTALASPVPAVLVSGAIWGGRSFEALLFTGIWLGAAFLVCLWAGWEVLQNL